MMFYGIIDTIGEGMTALILKTDKQIKLMSSMIEGADEDLNNKKAFGNFYNFRSLVRGICIFIGGVLSTRVPAGWVFLGIGAQAIAFAAYTLFGFYEPKRTAWFHPLTGFFGDIKGIFWTMVTPSVGLPFLFMILLNLVPTLSNVQTYILLNVGHWTYLDLSSQSLLFAFLYFVMLYFFINQLKKLNFGVMNVMAAAFAFLFNLSNFALLMTRVIPFYAMFGIQLAAGFVQSLAGDLPMISVIGRFSEIVPQGLEATGITLLISIMNFTGVLGLKFNAWELSNWNVDEGHYDRLFVPYIVNCVLSLGVILIAPLLVIW